MVPAPGQEDKFPTVALCTPDSATSGDKMCGSAGCLIYKANVGLDPVQECKEKCLTKRAMAAALRTGAIQVGGYATVAVVSEFAGPEVGVPVTLLYTAWRQGKNAKIARATLGGAALARAIAECEKECKDCK